MSLEIDFILKRHLLQFQKNWIYSKGVSSRDTFHNFIKFNIYIKGVSSRNTFHNFKKFNLYYKCLLDLILY